jgi:hypothetical protein
MGLSGAAANRQSSVGHFFGFHLHRIPACPAPLDFAWAGPIVRNPAFWRYPYRFFSLLTCLVAITLLRQRSNQSPPRIIWDEVWNNA